MDFAAFGEDDFDVKKWVNTTLDQRVEGDSIDTHISTAVMKLQLRAQDVNDAVEQFMSQTISAVPRTVSICVVQGFV